MKTNEQRKYQTIGINNNQDFKNEENESGVQKRRL